MQFTTIGKYKIVEKIGAGAMGDVYKAQDAVLNRSVAIKTIAAELGADDTLRKRFEREAQSAARLNHPNIITVYDFGEEHDRLYMAMELLDGTDLKQVIKDRSVTTLDQKLAIMIQICEGLAFAHAHEIVHRDLKPANIHVTLNGQVKIMDFGLARLSGSEMTRTGMVLGTPNYMSPEQVRGERADARSDIFALGCVFYELIAFQKAFEADSMHAVLFKVMQEEPRALAEVLPDVPLALAQVIEKSLAKDAVERFQNAGEMLGPLQRARQAVASGRGHEPLADLPAPSGREARSALASSVANRPSAAAGSRPTSGARRAVTAPLPIPEAKPVPSRPPYAMAGGLIAVGLLAGALVVAFRPKAPATPTRPAQVDNLARAVVDTQVELARKKLASGESVEAARQAERALKLDPANVDAAQVLAEARKVLDAVAQAETTAKAADASGDSAKAAEAFWALIQLAPDSAVAAELTPRLDGALKLQAREAQTQTADARQAAQKAGMAKTDRFLDAETRAKGAEEALKNGSFALAARRFIEARDRFDQATRDLR
jgi:tRNA A-37 threonylcarbamoyl transferase component Bud32/tetratricopeptide (TPR) repeat protein